MDRASLAARIQDILKNRRKPVGTEDPGAARADGGAGANAQAGVLANAGTPFDEAQGVPSASRGTEAGATRVDASDEGAAFAARCAAAEASSRVLEVLGAARLDDPAGSCLVVERHYPLTHRHGHHSVERYQSAARSARSVLPCFLQKNRPETATGGSERTSPDLFPADAEPALLFFDLETTGLSGGAGTYAFLVGFGSFDDEGFRTRQFFLRGYGEERGLLHAVARHVADAASGPTVLVTYNGRGFDVPLIETRYQFNRLRSPFTDLDHVDMLSPARRLWKRRRRTGFQPVAPSDRKTGFQLSDRRTGFQPVEPDAAPGSCALTALERDILGLHRQDDVPGWEIPARYFGYARTGDASGLEAVLEHNRLDLLSLGAISGVILDMVGEGAGAVRERPDCLALGRLLEYLGRASDAERCYCAAAAPDGMLDADIDRHVRAEALHWLALHRRRARRYHESAEAWQELARIPGVDAERKREALEALAIYHEHRAKDLEAARTFALSALQLAADARHVDAVRHRLGRLSKKIGGGPSAAQLSSWPSR